MEENTTQLSQEPERAAPEMPQEEHYKPRPAYQIWAARIGLVIVIVAFVLYLLQIASGGQL